MGDSALFVLKGIEDMLQTEVKFFSMIRKEGERMYICLGKRALFLIDFEPPFQEQFYYAWVQRVIIDSDNLLLFQIDFSEGRPHSRAWRRNGCAMSWPSAGRPTRCFGSGGALRPAQNKSRLSHRLFFWRQLDALPGRSQCDVAAG